MVRLVDLTEKGMQLVIEYFNSYMVRLVVLILKKKILVIGKFQFLHGAIGGPIRFNQRVNAVFISIPTWCDWWANPEDRQMFYPEFQFLHGAIGGGQAAINGFFNYISIPTWCDWWTNA